MNSMNRFFLMLFFAVTTITAQTSMKTLKIPQKKESESVVMTWNKNTPEQEMQDDIKALAEYGVTISYTDVKRNDKNEIIALKMSYEDKNGSKGTLSYDNKNPIGTITFYKNGDEVGFGQSNSASNFPLFIGREDGNPFESYQFNFNDKEPLHGDWFNEEKNFSSDQKSKIIIKKDGKKPLVIEDGEVVEGGEDYTPEEIEEYKKSMTVIPGDFGGYNFNFGENRRDFEQLREQMDRMQQQLNKLMPESNSGQEEETKKAAEELQKAKKELEDAKKELQKTKSSLKVKKA